MPLFRRRFTPRLSLQRTRGVYMHLQLDSDEGRQTAARRRGGSSLRRCTPRGSSLNHMERLAAELGGGAEGPQAGGRYHDNAAEKRMADLEAYKQLNSAELERLKAELRNGPSGSPESSRLRLQRQSPPPRCCALRKLTYRPGMTKMSAALMTPVPRSHLSVRLWQRRPR